MHQTAFPFQIRELLKLKKFKIILGILALFLLKEIAVVIFLNGQPSYIADGYSEANTTRGAQYFAENGFTEYSGLGDLCYGDLFPDRGFKGQARDKGTTCDKHVYTHYPNGSEYLATPLMKLFGPNMFMIRLQPVLFNFTVACIFFALLFIYFGPSKAFVLGVVLLFPPMFHNYWHGLHHQGYALSFTLIQLIITWRYWTFGFSKWLFYPALFLMGFIQGWMTFDYAFIASFFSLPLFFFLKEKRGLKIMDFLLVAFFSGLGFTAAHLLHFYQVAGYYGSFDKAFEDLFHSAKYRFDNLGKTSGKVTKMKELNPLSVAKDFLWRVAGRGKYTAVNLINFVWIVLALKLIRRIDFGFKDLRFKFDVTRNEVYSVLAAVFVASLWSLVMRQHAYIHGFIARHYYLVYLFCAMVMVRGAHRVKEAQGE